MVVTLLVAMLTMTMSCNRQPVTSSPTELETEMRHLYGKNRVVTAPYDTALAVATRHGVFVGRQDSNLLVFKGIPYALPPTGERRWREAQPEPDDLAGRLVREAYYYGHAAIQSRLLTNAGSLYPQDEDCLTLNVWTAQQGMRSARRPVLVWVHGGSYVCGSTADPAYDAACLVKAHPEVVVVSINYRLGLLGFLDLSTLPDGKDYQRSANLGLLDQVEALRWIKDNIAAFGGDANQVTLFGQSAGGGSVALLASIDEAQGLFHRIIVQSGSVALTSSRAECQQLTKRVLSATDAHTVADLQALSQEQLITLTNTVGSYCCFPMRDGTLIPTDPYSRFDGYNSLVDMLIGTTRDETHLWIDAMGGNRKYQLATELWCRYIRHQLDSTSRQSYDQLMDTIASHSHSWRAADMLTELMFRAPAIAMAERHAAAGGKTYMYRWDKPLRNLDYGACHSVENAYVFNHPTRQIKMGDHYNTALMQQVQQMWVNFATTGNPSTEQHFWPTYDPTHRSTMLLSDTITTVTDPSPWQRRLAAPLLNQYISPLFGPLLAKFPLLAGIAIGSILILLLLLFILIRHFR